MKNIKKLKVVGSSMLAVSLLAGVAGCGTGNSAQTTSSGSSSSSSPETITVAWWGNQQINDRMMKIITLFEQKYPNIKVNPQYQGWSDYWTKLATQASAGNIPDVILMDYSYLNQYTGDNLLADMSPSQQNGSLDFSQVSKSDIVGGTLNGKLYGVPVGDNAPALAYDPAIFQKAGVAPLKPGYTWDDLANAATQIRDKLGSSGVWGIEPYDNSNMLFPYYLRDKGESFYNAQGTGFGFTPADLTAFFTYWQTLIKKGVAASPQDTQTVTDPTTDLIIQGKAPFDNLWSNQVTALDQNANANFPLLPLPSMAGGKQGNWIKPSALWSVTSQSKHMDADVKWINFYTNDLKANETMGPAFGIPINQTIRAQELKDLSSDPLAKAYQDEFNYVEFVEKNSTPISPPAPAFDSKIQTLFKNISDEVNYQKLTPEQASTQFEQQAQSIMQGN